MHRMGFWTVCVALLLCLGGCAKIGLEKADLARLKPDLKIGEQEVFSFAVLGDMRLADARGTAVVNRAVADINKREEAAFTVALGNLAAAGAFKELNLAKSALGNLTNAYYVAPGPSDADPAKAEPYATFDDVFSEMPWLQQRNGWALIGLSSMPDASGAARVPEAELEWLAKQLKRIANDRPIALFAHHALQPGASEDRLQNADDVLALFEGRPLRLVVSGAAGPDREETVGDILFVNVSGVSPGEQGPAGATPGYVLFHVDHDAVTNEHIAISG